MCCALSHHHSSSFTLFHSLLLSSSCFTFTTSSKHFHFSYVSVAHISYLLYIQLINLSFEFLFYIYYSCSFFLFSPFLSALPFSPETEAKCMKLCLADK